MREAEAYIPTHSHMHTSICTYVHMMLLNVHLLTHTQPDNDISAYTYERTLIISIEVNGRTVGIFIIVRYIVGVRF